MIREKKKYQMANIQIAMAGSRRHGEAEQKKKEVKLISCQKSI